jgi:hypothetical protein
MSPFSVLFLLLFASKVSKGGFGSFFHCFYVLATGHSFSTRRWCIYCARVSNVFWRIGTEGVLFMS